jgi:flavodoxin
MPRVLVVYYSRTGTTKRVAAQIAGALSADLEQIVDRTPRIGLVGYLRSGFEATFGRRTRVDAPKSESGLYDLVIVGSPVWNASLSSPVRTYLGDNRGRLKDVAFFCTCGGRGGERVLEQMAAIVGKKPIATLILREAAVLHTNAGRDLERFEGDVRAALDAMRQPAAAPPPI